MDAAKDVVGFAFLPQQQLVPQMGPQYCKSFITQAYSNYAMDPSQVIFSLSELSLPLIFYVDVTVFAFYCQVLMWSQVTPMGHSHLIFTTATLWNRPVAGMCASWCWCLDHARSVVNSSPPLLQFGGASCYTATSAIQSIW